MALIDKASLLMVPSTYEAGKLYNVLPSGNRAPDSTGQNSGYDQTRADFDFDRGSNTAATRIDSNGVLQKYRENLLLNSNQFDTTWETTPYGTNATSGQSGYDGSSDAWLLSKTSSSGLVLQSISKSGVHTFSVYAKSGTLNWVRLLVTAGTNATQYINLTDGSLGTASAGTIDATATSVGNGWYRVTLTINDSAINSVRIYPADSDGVTSGTSGNILIQSAQLESGLVATDYLESTSVTGKAGVLVDLPRINYDANGENGALLLEPSRQQLIQYSEYFGAWNNVSQGTGIAPTLSIGGDFPLGDGLYYNLQCDLNGGTTSSDRSYISLSGLSGTQFTAAKSIWIKNNSASEAVLFMGINFSADKFTLAANADWQRITIDGGVINSEFRIGLGGGSSQSDTIDVSIFGAQLELGSYVSSYIPNHGESGGVTRAADSCSVTGASDVIGQTEGTIFVDFSFDSITSENRQIFQLSDGSTNNLHFRIRNSNHLQTYGSGNFSPFDERLSLTEGGRYKMALGYSNGDFAYYVNGVQIATDTQSTTASNLSEIYLGINDLSSTPLGGIVQEATLFKERLTNAELATLTTL